MDRLPFSPPNVWRAIQEAGGPEALKPPRRRVAPLREAVRVDNTATAGVGR